MSVPLGTTLMGVVEMSMALATNGFSTVRGEPRWSAPASENPLSTIGLLAAGFSVGVAPPLLPRGRAADRR
jgi:hypothetical protein